jgi:hypothetical protein
MLPKDMKRALKRPDWVDLVPAEQTLLERLVPRRLILRSDRRPGNRAATASRSPFVIECQERNARSGHRPIVSSERSAQRDCWFADRSEDLNKEANRLASSTRPFRRK